MQFSVENNSSPFLVCFNPQQVYEIGFVSLIFVYILFCIQFWEMHFLDTWNKIPRIFLKAPDNNV